MFKQQASRSFEVRRHAKRAALTALLVACNSVASQAADEAKQTVAQDQPVEIRLIPPSTHLGPLTAVPTLVPIGQKNPPATTTPRSQVRLNPHVIAPASTHSESVVPSAAEKAGSHFHLSAAAPGEPAPVKRSAGGVSLAFSDGIAAVADAPRRPHIRVAAPPILLDPAAEPAPEKNDDPLTGSRAVHVAGHGPATTPDRPAARSAVRGAMEVAFPVIPDTPAPAAPQNRPAAQTRPAEQSPAAKTSPGNQAPAAGQAQPAGQLPRSSAGASGRDHAQPGRAVTSPHARELNTPVQPKLPVPFQPTAQLEPTVQRIDRPMAPLTPADPIRSATVERAALPAELPRPPADESEPHHRSATPAASDRSGQDTTESHSADLPSVAAAPRIARLAKTLVIDVPRSLLGATETPATTGAPSETNVAPGATATPGPIATASEASASVESRPLTWAPASEVVVVTAAQTHAVRPAQPVQRVQLENREICDAVLVGPHQLLLIGRTEGKTRLALWCQDQTEPTVYELQVVLAPQTPVGSSLDAVATRLTDTIAVNFPGATVRVLAHGEGLVVQGQVASDQQAREILRLVRTACLKSVNDRLQVR